MMKLGVSLRFPGTCEAAFEFYRTVFGGELQMLQRYKEMRAHGFEIAPEDEEKVAFVALPVSEGFILAGDDNIEAPETCVPSTSAILLASVDSREEVDRIYAALSEGGAPTSPPAYFYWGDYFGGLRDRFGIWWYVNCHDPQDRT
jgi:PhnB protein